MWEAIFDQYIIRQKVFEFVLKTLISNTLCLQIEKKNVEGLIVIVNFFKFLATLFEFFLYFTWNQIWNNKLMW